MKHPLSPRRSRLPRTLAGSAVLIGLTLSLAGCGGSDAATPAASSSAASSAPSGNPPGGNSDQFAAIQSCLKAAGITVPDRASGAPGRPSAGAPSGGPPSGMPSGGPPSGMPSGGTRPSGAPSGGPGGGGGIDFTNAKVKAALQACGIAVPSGMPTAQPSS